jgi:hypothetical protein
VRDFHFLVTISDSHANAHQVATGIWAQFLLHRLGEAILFSRLNHPLGWFEVSAAYAGVVWLLFIYDMRLIWARVAESSSDAERALYARAKADQLLNIWLLVPSLFLFNFGCAIAIWSWPDFFLTRSGHGWLISARLISFIVYLVYIAGYFKTIALLILRAREAS